MVRTYFQTGREAVDAMLGPGNRVESEVLGAECFVLRVREREWIYYSKHENASLK